MSEAPIESRQFIGWWRDAVSDAITSSAYTGERAIHSSDFFAFTKRSHCPSLLRFSGPKILYFGRDSSICTSATAYSGTLFSLRWSAMDYRRCQPPCERFIARDHPHSKCVKCFDFKFCENLRLITLSSRLEVCEKESSILPVALRRPPRLRVNPWPLVNLQPGVRMLSSRRRRVSRQASPFSPSLTGACAREFTGWIRALLSLS